VVLSPRFVTTADANAEVLHHAFQETLSGRVVLDDLPVTLSRSDSIAYICLEDVCYVLSYSRTGRRPDRCCSSIHCARIPTSMFGDSVCMFTVVTTTHVPNHGTLSVYCLSGLCLFSVATATASLLKKTSRQTHALPYSSCRRYLFPRTIIDLVLCLRAPG
jgi:hypothetical protein